MNAGKMVEVEEKDLLLMLMSIFRNNNIGYKWNVDKNE